MKDRYSIARLVLVGLVFHLVFIASVFDCYFTSPVVHGMNSYNLGKAQAKRLVLIVGDGLRADLLLNQYPFPKIKNSPKIVAPYLRNIIETRGAFGISHTRVPTESRPGHVAIIAGMYEDVSAVTKGWKTNPVDFDSVFNQSSTTFSFGSPDILPMFTRGAVPGRVLEWSYDAEEEDFTKDAVELDNWVLNQLETLFQNATTDPTLNSKMRSEKVVFFLHLLGLDTTGHSYRPHSPEYMQNIQVVDQIVQRTEQLMNDFYQDNETSFVFTADHGMSVIGNHGDGNPDCTRTPIIAWGKGIRGPLPGTAATTSNSYSSSHDAYSKPWGLGHLYRRDISQADIAPLMATLIGSSWPMNSVGVLPDVDPNQKGFLDMDDKSLAEVSLLNAKVILEQYRIKHELKQSKTWNYKPYNPLTSPLTNLKSIQTLISKSQYTSARNSSFSLIYEALEGLHYLQTYDQTLLRSVVVLAYLGWMLFAGLFVIQSLESESDLGSGSGLGSGSSSGSTSIVSESRGKGKVIIVLHQRPTSSQTSRIQNQLHSLIFKLTKHIPTTLLSIWWLLFWIQGSPWSYYLYIVFPAYFWYQVLDQGLPLLISWFIGEVLSGRDDRDVNDKVEGRRGGRGGLKGGLRKLMGFGCYIGAVVWVLVQFAKGYTTRSMWTFGTIILSSNWLISFDNFDFHKSLDSLRSAKVGIFGGNNNDKLGLGKVGLGLGLGSAWIGVTLVCSIFPILDVDREESLFFISLGGLLFILIGLIFGRRFMEDMGHEFGEGVKKSQFRLLIVQLSFIAAITVTTLLSAHSLQKKQGLPFILQILNWIFLVIPSLLPYLYQNPNPQTVQAKTLMYFLSFGPCFVILSLSVEGLFFIAYSAVLAVWVVTEREIRVGLVKSEGKSGLNSNASSKGEVHLRLLRDKNNTSDLCGKLDLDFGEGLKPEELEKVYRFRKDDVRVALILLFLVHLGFFGIGNVPSISSFYLAPVYRLIPVFSPFSMATLLLYKLLAPFVMLSIQISLLNEALNLAPFSLLLVSFSINDIMTLLFFFRVKDTGSWLEIGESITFFFITSLLFLFTSAMSIFGEWLMKDVLDRMWIDTLQNAGLKLKLKID